MPTTLKSYINGIQRALAFEFGYQFNFFQDYPFADKNDGFMTAVDNKIRKQQAQGVTRQSHKVLTWENITRPYDSNALSKSHAKRFCTRMIFNIAFMTSFRPTELSNLLLEDVTSIQTEKGEAWRIVGRIGTLDGASKMQKGGIKYVNVKPKDVLVWNRDMLNGAVNVYKDIEEYLGVVRRIRSRSDKFFVAVNYKSAALSTFFKAMNLGKNSFLKYIQDACKSMGITGSGVRDKMTMHGLRGTVKIQLSEAGHADSSVALRSGHRSMEAIKAYQNLRGKLGLRQQEHILDGVTNNENRVGERQTMSAKELGETEVTDENAEPNVCDVQKKTGSVQKDVEFLTGVGTVSGPITINLNYNGEREGCERVDWDRTVRDE